MDEPTPPDRLPAPLYTITTLDALKVFADTLRQQIIEVLLDGSKTVKQIAAELELAPTKLYYHVNLLEEHGLISVSETRIVSGIIEKHYVASAHQYQIERTLLTPGQNATNEGLDALLDAMIDPLRLEVAKSIQQGLIDTSSDAPAHRKLRMWRAMSRLSPQQADDFYDKLETLIEEFNAFKTEESDPSDLAYGLLISIYPTISPKKPSKD